jgi:hypothetical protein
MSDRQAKDAASARERRARLRHAEPEPAAGCHCERSRPMRDQDGDLHCLNCGRSCEVGTIANASGRRTGS